MRVIGWKAWYTEQRKFDSRQTAWADLPDDGVLLLMLYFDSRDGQKRPKRMIMSGNDYYFSDGDQLFGSSNQDPDAIRERYPTCAVKQGKWTTYPDIERVNSEAIADYGMG